MSGPELLTAAGMAEADRLAIASGIPSRTLMENAGRAVADEAEKMVTSGARITVLCGPGNNGGDGFVAARLLRARGYDVRVACLVTIDQIKGDSAAMAKQWGGEVAALHPRVLDGATLAIDAIFGAGLNKVVPPDVGRIGAELRKRELPVLAVDVPSGLDGTTGQILGTVIPAARTMTFVRRKVGHVLYPGRAVCGEVVVADIGIGADIVAAVGAKVVINRAPGWSPPLDEVHKYQRGHVLVMSGPPHATGAARLAARGALRAGAGAVSLASAPDAVTINAAHLTAIMIKPYASADELKQMVQDDFECVVIGPAAGVGALTRENVRIILETGNERPTVLDADALTSFERDQDELFAMTRNNGRVVMTPHEGEFQRLFGELPGSKVDRAVRAAEISGATIVLKGPDTVIAGKNRGGVMATINDNAPSWLATAGSGDVLAGFIAALLSQGLSAYPAACAAVWLHGECANVFGPGLIAEDLPEVLPKVLRGLGTSG